MSKSGDSKSSDPNGKPAVTFAGTVKKIVNHEQPETAQITVDEAEELYRELRIPNVLEDSNGEEVSLKEGTEVDVVIKAPHDGVEKNDRPKMLVSYCLGKGPTSVVPFSRIDIDIVALAAEGRGGGQTHKFTVGRSKYKTDRVQIWKEYYQASSPLQPNTSFAAITVLLWIVTVSSSRRA